MKKCPSCPPEIRKELKALKENKCEERVIKMVEHELTRAELHQRERRHSSDEESDFDDSDDAAQLRRQSVLQLKLGGKQMKRSVHNYMLNKLVPVLVMVADRR